MNTRNSQFDRKMILAWSALFKGEVTSFETLLKEMNFDACLKEWSGLISALEKIKSKTPQANEFLNNARQYFKLSDKDELAMASIGLRKRIRWLYYNNKKAINEISQLNSIDFLNHQLNELAQDKVEYNHNLELASAGFESTVKLLKDISLVDLIAFQEAISTANPKTMAQFNSHELPKHFFPEKITQLLNAIKDLFFIVNEILIVKNNYGLIEKWLFLEEISNIDLKLERFDLVKSDLICSKITELGLKGYEELCRLGASMGVFHNQLIISFQDNALIENLAIKIENEANIVVRQIQFITKIQEEIEEEIEKIEKFTLDGNPNPYLRKQVEQVSLYELHRHFEFETILTENDDTVAYQFKRLDEVRINYFKTIPREQLSKFLADDYYILNRKQKQKRIDVKSIAIVPIVQGEEHFTTLVIYHDKQSNLHAYVIAPHSNSIVYSSENFCEELESELKATYFGNYPKITVHNLKIETQAIRGNISSGMYAVNFQELISFLPDVVLSNPALVQFILSNTSLSRRNNDNKKIGLVNQVEEKNKDDLMIPHENLKYANVNRPAYSSLLFKFAKACEDLDIAIKNKGEENHKPFQAALNTIMDEVAKGEVDAKELRIVTKSLEAMTKIVKNVNSEDFNRSLNSLKKISLPGDLSRTKIYTGLGVGVGFGMLGLVGAGAIAAIVLSGGILTPFAIAGLVVAGVAVALASATGFVYAASGKEKGIAAAIGEAVQGIQPKEIVSNINQHSNLLQSNRTILHPVPVTLSPTVSIVPTKTIETKQEKQPVMKPTPIVIKTGSALEKPNSIKPIPPILEEFISPTEAQAIKQATENSLAIKQLTGITDNSLTEVQKIVQATENSLNNAGLNQALVIKHTSLTKEERFDYIELLYERDKQVPSDPEQRHQQKVTKGQWTYGDEHMRSSMMQLGFSSYLLEPHLKYDGMQSKKSYIRSNDNQYDVYYLNSRSDKEIIMQRGNAFISSGEEYLQKNLFLEQLINYAILKASTENGKLDNVRFALSLETGGHHISVCLQAELESNKIEAGNALLEKIQEKLKSNLGNVDPYRAYNEIYNDRKIVNEIKTLYGNVEAHFFDSLVGKTDPKRCHRVANSLREAFDCLKGKGDDILKISLPFIQTDGGAKVEQVGYGCGPVECENMHRFLLHGRPIDDEYVRDVLKESITLRNNYYKSLYKEAGKAFDDYCDTIDVCRILDNSGIQVYMDSCFGDWNQESKPTKIGKYDVFHVDAIEDTDKVKRISPNFILKILVQYALLKARQGESMDNIRVDIQLHVGTNSAGHFLPLCIQADSINGDLAKRILSEIKAWDKKGKTHEDLLINTEIVELIKAAYEKVEANFFDSTRNSWIIPSPDNKYGNVLERKSRIERALKSAFKKPVPLEQSKPLIQTTSNICGPLSCAQGEHFLRTGRPVTMEDVRLHPANNPSVALNSSTVYGVKAVVKSPDKKVETESEEMESEKFEKTTSGGDSPPRKARNRSASV